MIAGELVADAFVVDFLGGEETPLVKPRTDESGRSDLLLLLLDAVTPDFVSPAAADLREDDVEELLLEPPLRVFAILASWSCSYEVVIWCQGKGPVNPSTGSRVDGRSGKVYKSS